MIIDLQKDRDDIKRELEKTIRDNHLSIILRQDEIQSFLDKEKDMEEKLMKKRDKKRELKKAKSFKKSNL